MRNNIYQKLKIYNDCIQLLDHVTNVYEVIRSNNLFFDSRGWRSSNGVTTNWEKKAIFRITKYTGDTNPNNWKGQYEGQNVRIWKKGKKKEELKEGITQLTVPIWQLNQEESEQTFNINNVKGFTNNVRGATFYPTQQNSADIQSQRTLSQSLGDLSQLLGVLAALTTSLAAVRSGVFGAAARRAISKLKTSKQGIEQAAQEIKTVSK